jgi:hypothetical protein
MNDLITKIETLQPHPTEAIVVRFNFNSINIDNMRQVFKEVQENFPNNTVVGIPDHVSLQSCSKYTLENIIAEIKKIIEEL